jgi:hypothetical protein
MLATLLEVSQVAGNWATVGAAVVVAVAAIYGVRTLREAQRSRRLTSMMPLFDRLHGPEAAERRRELYQRIRFRDGDLCPADEKIVQQIVTDFHIVGYLVENGLVEFKLIAELYYTAVLKCWDACEDYILAEHRRRHTTDYASYFKSLRERCTCYSGEKHGGVMPATYPSERPGGLAERCKAKLQRVCR